ncbi:uncharacterized protein PAC_20174 [Phialocephala subalpina]|uniref:MYND-type domain-containing protein n=1 Tax=Phialocephala subalpina TaxID=576137 RepID=A0A1L7XYX6_9HELO|nr:uncharacterized protein PAC_20174 [Phialocephala subalpina]
MAPSGCAVCGIDTNLVCKNCKSAGYCSSTCQAKDLALHQLLCGKLQPFLEANPRPENNYTTTHKLALLFDKNENSPEFIWIETKITMSDDGTYNLTCDLSEWLGYDGDADGGSGDGEAFIHARHDKKIQVWKASGAIAQNPGIFTLTEGGWDFGMVDDAYPDRLRGTIIGMGVESLKDDTRVTKYRDVTLDDLRVALSCFLEDSYMFDVHKSHEDGYNPYVILDQPEWFKAVKINNREEYFSKTNPFQEVMLNRNMRQWHSDKSAISELMGITLLVRKFPLYRDTFKDRINPEAISLLLNVNTSEDNEFWGRVPFPKYDSGKDPTFLVFRKDKQEITKQQVEALSSYCQVVLCQVLEEPEEWSWEKEDQEAVLDVYCSAEKFEEYFETFKLEKVAEGDETWVDASPPSGMRAAGIAEEDPEPGAKRRRVTSPPADDEDEVSEDENSEDETSEERHRRFLAYANWKVNLALGRG